MSNKDQARWKLQKTFAQKQNLIYARPGILGDGEGNVTVTGRASYVYVRVADVTTQVFNVRVPPTNDLQVLVGYDPMQPYLPQVLSTRTSEPGQNAGVTGYAPASHYEWMGDDPVFIDKRLWLPRRISCYLGMAVKLYPDMFWTGTAYIALAETIIDLSSPVDYRATTSGKMTLVLITIDTTGTIVLTASGEVDIATATTADIPVPPPGTSDVLACVRCYYGQTAVQEAITNTDILDLRLTYFGTGGGAGNPNLDGGEADSNYGGITAIDGGSA
jgi:hypothetical protein